MILHIVEALVITIVSLWLHELGHALAAKFCHDSYGARRLTLRPLVNLDPLFSFVLPLVSAVATLGHIALGIGRPFVLVKHRWQIALAGPLVNLMLAAALWAVWPKAAYTNLVIGAFNLIPVPPLDGWWVMTLWRSRWQDQFSKWWATRTGRGHEKDGEESNVA